MCHFECSCCMVAVARRTLMLLELIQKESTFPPRWFFSCSISVQQRARIEMPKKCKKHVLLAVHHLFLAALTFLTKHAAMLSSKRKPILYWCANSTKIFNFTASRIGNQKSVAVRYIYFCAQLRGKQFSMLQTGQLWRSCHWISEKRYHSVALFSSR